MKKPLALALTLALGIFSFSPLLMLLAHWSISFFFISSQIYEPSVAESACA